jgi:hypothetical protein
VALLPPAAGADTAPTAHTPGITAADGGITEDWAIEYSGYNRSSSPAVGDLDGDGIPDIVWGDENGLLYAVDVDGDPLPGFPVPAVIPPSTTPSSIGSSPTLADLDGNGDLEIIVGVGSLWTDRHRGGLMVVEHDGTIRWAREGFDKFNLWTGLFPADGLGEPVHGTAAVGDVDGDGRPEIVWGGWDHRVWAADADGNILPGFPFDNLDTIWGSVALFDNDDDGRVEIFIGGDATVGATPCGGGRYWALDYNGGEVTPVWTKCTGEAFKSSTAIADLDGDGRYEIVIGGGDFYGHPDGKRVFAWHVDDGSDLGGWPVTVGGSVYSSPAIGDLDGDGRPEVVVTAWDERVYAIHPDGSLMWSSHPTLASDTAHRAGNFFGSAIIADLDGDGAQDVVATNLYATWALRGSDGSQLRDEPMNLHWAMMAAGAPTVADFGPRGWKVVAAGNRALEETHSRLAVYSIPTPGTEPSWPVWRGNQAHTAAPAPTRAPRGPGFCSGSLNPTAEPSAGAAAGYWILNADGGVDTFGDAPHLGDARTVMAPGRRAVALTETHTGDGYWVLDDGGGVHAFGDAQDHGSMAGHTLNAPIISMAATPSGNGYWLLGEDGGVFSFGAARFAGSTGNLLLTSPVISMAPTTTGQGYWLLAADGGVFSFGDAVFRGSTGAMHLAAPIISMAVHPEGSGYWLLGRDGGVFSFGVPFRGSVPGIGLCTPPDAIELRSTSTGRGYYALSVDGGIFSFGDAPYHGADPSLTDPVDLAVRF